LCFSVWRILLGGRFVVDSSPDRIAREVEYQRIIVGELLKHGKQITINGKDYEQNPENKLTLTMLGAFAEFERAKIIERVTRGLRMGEPGVVPTGTPPVLGWN
jgi:DNA invertase Pin-like site-specific DNA recombinase